MTSEREAVIVSAYRTAIGRFGGSLSTIPAPQLGAVAIGEAIRRGLRPRRSRQGGAGCVNLP